MEKRLLQLTITLTYGKWRHVTGIFNLSICDKPVQIEGQPKHDSGSFWIKEGIYLGEKESVPKDNAHPRTIRRRRPPGKGLSDVKPGGAGGILLRSGDIETNLGPEGQVDPTREREEEPFDDTIGCVLWNMPKVEAFRQNKLHINAVLANRLFKKELAKRVSNALSIVIARNTWGRIAVLAATKG